MAKLKTYMHVHMDGKPILSCKSHATFLILAFKSSYAKMSKEVNSQISFRRKPLIAFAIWTLVNQHIRTRSITLNRNLKRYKFIDMH